jgi:hypothetical protein
MACITVGGLHNWSNLVLGHRLIDGAGEKGVWGSYPSRIVPQTPWSADSDSETRSAKLHPLYAVPTMR